VKILPLLKIVLGQAGRLEDEAESSRRHVAGVHRHISLTAVGVAQNDMGTEVSPDHKTRALRFRHPDQVSTRSLQPQT